MKSGQKGVWFWLKGLDLKGFISRVGGLDSWCVCFLWHVFMLDTLCNIFLFKKTISDAEYFADNFEKDKIL